VSYLNAILLGVIEGVTEFLPISSTGHLLIAEHWLPRQSDLFNVIIQCGAVLAVLAVFRNRAVELLSGWRESEKRDYLFKLAVAFLLTAIGGVVLKQAGLKLPKEIAPVAWATLIGGPLIFLIEWGLRGRATTRNVSWLVVVVVAAAQLLAASCPGTSRSGATILFAMAIGVARAEATEFSFLVGIPTMFAAGGYELIHELRHGGVEGAPWGHIIVGTMAAAVTAFGVVRWLLRFVQTHTFVAFGWYRILLGAALLLLPRN
jgi:undecaprenyl-diphosphatase